MTSKAIRRAIHEVLSDSLVAAGLINADDFKRYATAPTDSSTRPYFGFVATASQDLEMGTMGGDFINPRLTVWGFAKISDDETVKEAAQDWLDDFEEEVIVTLAHTVNENEYLQINQLGQPRRNPDPRYHTRYQTTAILIEVLER